MVKAEKSEVSGNILNLHDSNINSSKICRPLPQLKLILDSMHGGVHRDDGLGGLLFRKKPPKLAKKC